MFRKKTRLPRIILILLFFTINSVHSEPWEKKSSDIFVGENYRLYPSDITQTEPFIVTNPNDPDIIFSTANTVNFQPFFISEGIYVSTNGAMSWTGNDTCSGEPIQFHGGDPGIAIDKNGTLILTRLGRTPFSGVYSHYSHDNGQTWSPQNTITTDVLERATTSSDGNTNSNYYGRTCSAWVKFAPPYALYYSFSDNGGIHWSEQTKINNPTQRCAGGDMAIGRTGTVHLCWAVVTSTSPFTEIFVGYANTQNGGENWWIKENAFPMNGIQGILPEKRNIRVNGLPRVAVDNSNSQRDGWLYVVTTQRSFSPAGGDPDIILNRSTDSGATWSEGIRVNQDAFNNGKIQFFPAITVDNSGGVNVIYYDDRNTISDSCSVFLSRSLDGGDTWTDYEISNHRFQPQPIGGLGQGYQGDNIDITTSDDKLLPVWMDNSSGIYQIWSATIELNSVGISEENAPIIPEEIELFQNYPNPFNQITQIRYSLPKTTNVNISVFNLIGQEIKILVDERKSAGTHVVDFNASQLPTGIYFYSLETAGYFDVKKMILIK